MITGVTNFRLNIRSVPDATRGRITTLAQGTRFTVISDQGDWLFIRTESGLDGYVASAFTTLTRADPENGERSASGQAAGSGESGESGGGTVSPPAESTLAVTIKGSRLNARSLPRVADDNLVATVFEGARLIPLESDAQVRRKVSAPASENQWLQVRLPDGKEGFVAAWLTKLLTEITPRDDESNLHVTPSGSRLNIRATPLVASNNLVGQVLGGEVLIPLESDDQVRDKVGSQEHQNLWLKVKLPDGQIGYAAAWLLRFVTANGTGSGAGTGATGGGVVITAPDLDSYIDAIPDADYPLPQSYHDFWQRREKLGLPDPFDVSPTQATTYDFKRMQVNGFGPNQFAHQNWQAYYRFVNGMHNGVDHIVPKGTPLLALSDGLIVGTQAHWRFLGSPLDPTLTLWCFMPEHIRDGQGRRMLSNALVAYGHMSNNTVVAPNTIVKAGEIIGYSGHPIYRNDDGTPRPDAGNPHLHWEVHLLSGDPNFPSNPKLSKYKRAQPFGNMTPLNPMLMFTPRLAKYHLHQGKVVGYSGGPTYPPKHILDRAGLGAWPPLDFFSVAMYRYSRAVIWGMGKLPWTNNIFDMPTLLDRIDNQYTAFEPYPMDFV